MDVGSRQRLCSLALCLLSAGLLPGCAQPKSGLLAQWNPFYKEDDYDPRQYGPTIDDHVEQVREMADRAGRMTPEEREQAAQQLGARLQQERSPTMKRELVRTLGRLQTPMADAALKMALADPDPVIRRTAVEGWGARRTPQAVEELGRTISSDTDLDVRMAAAKALGTFNDRAAIESLGVALDDPDPAMQYCAIQSLRTATGRDYGGDVAAWRQVVQGIEPTNFERPSFVQRWLSWY
jgi:HEAT repeat protein